MFIDGRIPVQFLDSLPDRGQNSQILLLSHDPAVASGPTGDWAAVQHLPAFVLQETQMAMHPPGCRCCLVRSASAVLLSGLFQARARGKVGFFRGIAALLPAHEAEALKRDLVEDPFLSGCFVDAGRISDDNADSISDVDARSGSDAND